MLTYSLFSPIAGLTLLQLLLWPWIYAQAIQLKRWVRATYGPGVPYYWRVTPFGRVYLYDAPFLTYDRYISHVPIHFVTEANRKRNSAPSTPRFLLAQRAQTPN